MFWLRPPQGLVKTATSPSRTPVTRRARCSETPLRTRRIGGPPRWPHGPASRRNPKCLPVSCRTKPLRTSATRARPKSPTAPETVRAFARQRRFVLLVVMAFSVEDGVRNFSGRRNGPTLLKLQVLQRRWHHTIIHLIGAGRLSCWESQMMERSITPLETEAQLSEEVRPPSRPEPSADLAGACPGQHCLNVRF
jgi:hypothetical protein